MSLRVFEAADVRRLLPMADCIEAMDRAMRATSAGDLALPLRSMARLADDSGVLAVMPGSALDPPVYGAKILGLHPGNPERGLPFIRGLVVLFEHGTGEPLAVLDAAELTAIRTAAASGLATRALARPEVRSLGILGTGVLARTHLDAILAVRQIEEVRVWGRSDDRAEDFAAWAHERSSLPTRVTSAELAGRCDVVCTVTAAHEPVLQGAWLRPGAHVNLVGAHTATTREADARTIARSAVYVDLIESAEEEAGDVLMAIEEGVVPKDWIVGEIGQVVARRLPGRRTSEQITLYKSVGVVSQDLYAAEAVLRAAQRETGGRGD